MQLSCGIDQYRTHMRWALQARSLRVQVLQSGSQSPTIAFPELRAFGPSQNGAPASPQLPLMSHPLAAHPLSILNKNCVNIIMSIIHLHANNPLTHDGNTHDFTTVALSTLLRAISGIATLTKRNHSQWQPLSLETSCMHMIEFSGRLEIYLRAYQGHKTLLQAQAHSAHSQHQRLPKSW